MYYRSRTLRERDNVLCIDSGAMLSMPLFNHHPHQGVRVWFWYLHPPLSPPIVSGEEEGCESASEPCTPVGKSS